MIVDACPIKQRPYQMNPNYAKKVRENLDKLLDAQFIFLIETARWLSPLVIVSKKNGQLRIFMDYRKLNSQTNKDPFPFPLQSSENG